MKYLTLCAVILVLGACESARVSAPPVNPTVGATIGGMGSWFVWIGGISLGLATIARLFATFTTLVPGPVGAFAALLPAGLLASVGAAGIALGSAFLYLGERPWLLGISIGATLLALSYTHRDDILRWLHLGKTVVPPVK